MRERRWRGCTGRRTRTTPSVAAASRVRRRASRPRVPTVVFAAPRFSENASQMIAAAAGLPGVRLGVVSQEPQEQAPPGVRGALAAHWRVVYILDTGQLA